MIRAMWSGISKRTLALVGAAVGLLVVGGLVGAVVALAADGGRAQAPTARPTGAPTLAADDPALPLAKADGYLTEAAAYADVLGEAAAGCGASRQWTAEQVGTVLDKGQPTTAWAMLTALRDKYPGADCATLTGYWALGWKLPARSGPSSVT